MKYQLKIDDKQFTVDIGEIEAGCIQVNVNGRPYTVSIEEGLAPVPEAQPLRPSPPPAAQPAAGVPKALSAAAPLKPVCVSGTGALVAPIPGLILKVNVAVGDAVAAGQTVAVMEAMKMENNLTSAVSGVVQDIRVQKGSEVATGDVIMVIA